MEKIKVAIVGYGNIGQYALQALLEAPDMEVAGVVRRKGAENLPKELQGYKVVKDIDELGKVDVAILATPTRSVEEYALQYLAKGINTVDSFDIHTKIVDLRRSLDKAAKACRQHHLCRMGSRKRQCSTHTYGKPCSQGHFLHQLRTRSLDGSQRMRALQGWSEGCPLNDHSRWSGHSSPYGLCGTGGRC